MGKSDLLPELLEALYLFKTAPVEEKAHYRSELYRLVDMIDDPRLSRQDVIGHLLSNHYPEYYKRRVRQDTQGV